MSAPPPLIASSVDDTNHSKQRVFAACSVPLPAKRMRDKDAVNNIPSASSVKRSREEPVELHWGCHSAIGGRSYQEDAHVTAQRLLGSSDHQLFGVFDGHGGSVVSKFMARHSAAYISAAILKNRDVPGRQQMEHVALKEAFVRLDADLPSSLDTKDLGGSTAIVLLLSTSKLTCANTGDSRAVLARGGEAVALSDDHTPERKDEQVRVQAAGGRVIHNCGARVMGVLGMTRAIGDTWLRQFGVIPDPDVLEVDRCAEDEFVIIASDGLWGTVSSEEAVEMARRCLDRAMSKGVSRDAAARIAAKVLMRAAMSRGSRDNITVIVIDLQEKRVGNANEEDQQSAACQQGPPAVLEHSGPCKPLPDCIVQVEALAVRNAYAIPGSDAHDHEVLVVAGDAVLPGSNFQDNAVLAVGQGSGLPSPVTAPTLDTDQHQEEYYPDAPTSPQPSNGRHAAAATAGLQRLHLSRYSSLVQTQRPYGILLQQWNPVGSLSTCPRDFSGSTSSPTPLPDTLVQVQGPPTDGPPPRN